MGNELRISEDPSVFTQYMVLTNKTQTQIMTPPDIQRYTKYGWTLDESKQWDIYTQKSVEMFAILSNPDTTGPGIRKKMKAFIKEVRKYDNDKAEGHHLLDKVAMNGEPSDCLTFNVKRGTIFQADPTHPGDDVEMKSPKISIEENKQGEQLLKAVNPDTPKSVKLPEGVIACLIFRVISDKAPTNLNEYKFAGSAHRGKYVSKLTENETTGSVKLYAYYYACYMNKKGELGKPSNIEKAQVIFDVA